MGLNTAFPLPPHLTNYGSRFSTLPLHKRSMAATMIESLANFVNSVFNRLVPFRLSSTHNNEELVKLSTKIDEFRKEVNEIRQSITKLEEAEVNHPNDNLMANSLKPPPTNLS
ncbi:hypothetical protein PTT_14382 [Pyrenophora teres f. teres 0-1]|uniref:Uncharacterized protein n=1 Tax=Pyrenophora teres f. teres (strain 0-1) TaxID=861557 RepID=E3RY26_PYRTT|nr:hypothetical protein PTT_14382 [Pyrenophora teres f. teres 0-1]